MAEEEMQRAILDGILELVEQGKKGKSTAKGTGDTSDFFRSFTKFSSILDITQDKISQFNKSVDSTSSRLTFLQAAVTTGAAKQSQIIEQLASKKAEINQFKKEVEALEISAKRLQMSTDDADRAEGERLETLLKTRKLEGGFDNIAKQEAQLRRQNLTFLRNYFPNLAKEYFTYNGIVKDAGKALAGASSFALKQAGSLMNSGDMFGPVQAGFEAGVDILNKGSQGAAKGMQNVGAAMMTVPGPTMAVGAALTAIGTVIGGASEAVSKLAKEGFSIMVDQTKKLISAYDGLIATGAVFGNGITGMVTAAGNAGLTVEHFSNVVKKQSANLALAGLGVTAGAKVMGEVTASFKQSGVREQLRALGYSFEEQAELTADVMANIRRSGGAPGTTQQIATQTEKYAENLRLISAITGEDAKKKQAQAAEQNNYLAFQQKMASKSTDQRAAINLAMANMTEQEKKNFRERVVLGTVINKEGAIYEATVSGAREKSEEMLALFNNNNLTAGTVAELNVKYGEQIKESALAQTALATAASVVGGVLAGVATAGMDAVTQAQYSTKEALNAARENIAEAKAAQDESTKNLMNAATAAYNLQLELQKLVLAALPAFSSIVDKIITGYQDVFDAIRKAIGLNSTTTTTAAATFKKTDELTAAKVAGDTGAVRKIRRGQAAEIVNKAFSTKGNTKTSTELKDELNAEEARVAPVKEKTSLGSSLTPIVKSLSDAVDNVSKVTKPDVPAPTSTATLPTSIPMNSELIEVMKAQTVILASNNAKYDKIISTLQDSATTQKNILNATQ